MRRIAAVMLFVLWACGDGEDGDDGGGTDVTLTGEISGSVSNATSVSVTGACTFESLSVGISAAAIGITTAANPCQALQQGRDPANATILGIALVRVGLGGSVPLATGTYAFWDPLTSPGDPPADGQLGVVRFFFGEVEKNGGPVAGQPSCEEITADITGGTVTVSSISSSGIVGSVDLTLSNGGTARGSFDAPACSVAASVDPTSCEVDLPSAVTCQ